MRSNIPHDQKYIVGKIAGDLSSKNQKEFWNIMKLNNWAFLKDADFKDISPRDLPKSLNHLQNNPLRSMVSIILRESSPFEFRKVGIPFEEFFYAEFLSKRLSKIPGDTAREMNTSVQETVKILRTIEGQNFLRTLPYKVCELRFLR